MHEFTIVNYSQDFYEKINTFWNETGLGGKQRGDNEAIIQNTIDAGGHLLILINGTREVIGTSWLTNDKRRTYLHHFGIKESFRNRGLAKLLLRKSLEIAEKDGYQIKLEVHKDNIVATNLYKSHHFKLLGNYEVFIKRELHSL